MHPEAPTPGARGLLGTPAGTGRRRVSDASRSEASFSSPRSCKVFANCTIRMPFAVPPLGLDERLRLRADLVAATRAPIDLVPLGEASVALVFEVVDSGECLFARSPDIETEFALRARMRYLDYRPYLEQQWRTAGERAEERLRGATT